VLIARWLSIALRHSTLFRDTTGHLKPALPRNRATATATAVAVASAAAVTSND